MNLSIQFKKIIKDISILLIVLTSQLSFAQRIDVQISHPSLVTEIGKPAIIDTGQSFPRFHITSKYHCSFQASLYFEERDSLIENYNDVGLYAGQKYEVSFLSSDQAPGRYRIDFWFDIGAEDLIYDSYYFTVVGTTKLTRHYSNIVYQDSDGKLVYVPDFRGNRIPDFSTAGYMGGGVSTPDVPIKVVLDPTPGDDTERIQNAIDMVSDQIPDVNGIRGAVLLKKGFYEVSRTLIIKQSGVILRGEGQGNFKNLMLDPSKGHDLERFKRDIVDLNATVIITTTDRRQSLIEIKGAGLSIKIDSTATEIIDEYVPVGSKSFRIARPDKFKVGDKIILERNGNSDWISEIKMDQIPSLPGRLTTQWSPFILSFEYTIKEINGNIITIDGSIYNAIEKIWGGGQIYKCIDDARISNVGIENLRAISFWQKSKEGIDDTNHSDQFLLIYGATDSWVKNVTVEHFFSMHGAIKVAKGSKHITIENSSTLIADKEFYTGEKYNYSVTNKTTNVYVGRYGFLLEGQSTLVAGCYTLNNRHSFVVGARVSGPNVFLYCKADGSLTWSEPHHRWSVGGLYDNVHDNIALMNRLNFGSGHGWAGANYVAWKTKGNLICEQPPTAQNWAIGHEGLKVEGPFKGSDGYWEFSDFPLKPNSLYIQQLEDRLGSDQIPEFDFKFLQSKTFETKKSVWNYPNPAIYYTHFVFNLDQPETVQLKIYSISGHYVATLNKGLINEGRNELFWETVDGSGNQLPTGVYLYQLIAGGHILSNKLVISK